MKDRPYKCGFCSKAFTFEDYLKNHIQSNHENNVLNCSKCNEMFMNENEQKNHVKIAKRK